MLQKSELPRDERQSFTSDTVSTSSSENCEHLTPGGLGEGAGGGDVGVGGGGEGGGENGGEGGGSSGGGPHT